MRTEGGRCGPLKGRRAGNGKVRRGSGGRGNESVRVRNGTDVASETVSSNGCGGMTRARLASRPRGAGSDIFGGGGEEGMGGVVKGKDKRSILWDEGREMRGYLHEGRKGERPHRRQIP